MGKKRSAEEIHETKPTEPTMFNMTPPDVRRDRTTDGNKKAHETCSKADHRTSLRKLITLNNTLSDEKKKVVRAMGFGSMLQLKIKAIDNSLMGWLIKNFDPSTRVLKVCGKSIHITLDKVKSALGIPCTNQDIIDIQGSNMGRLRYDIIFQGREGQGMDLAELELKLTKCESASAEFKVMYIIFLCATVLLPKYGTFLELSLLNYLLDLDRVHTYNWGGIVLKSLVDGVEIHKKKNTTKVTGCIFLLQVIFVTELASMHPLHGKSIVSTTPYIEQWTQEEVNDILRMFAKIVDDTKSNAGTYIYEDKLNQQPLSGETASTSEVISLMRFIADQVQLLNRRMSIIEQRSTSVESAVSSLLANTCLKPKGNSESLRQENCRSGPEEDIMSFKNTGFTQGKHSIGNDFDSCNPSIPDTIFTQGQQNLKKNFDSCNPSSPNPNIKQEKQKILSPRVLNFETPEINVDGSENSKECTDIFRLVCEAMGEKDTGFEYLFDQRYDLSEMLVRFDTAEITRKSILCLQPKTWLNEEVINCVAYINWYDRKSSPDASRHWNLPTWFSTYAQSNVFTDKMINKSIFGSNDIFKGLPSRCSSISIPIHDTNHWLLCKVDFDRKIVEICDTLRTSDSQKRRLHLIENTVITLENISKLWSGKPFKHSNWHDTFKYCYSNTTPQQPNGYDCGLYVCLLMMFPEGINRALTEEESVVIRRRLALHLYNHSQNSAHPNPISVSVWVTPLPDKETCHRVPTKFNIEEMTLGGILKEVYKVSGEDVNGDTIELKDDEDLKKFTERHLGFDSQVIQIEVAWNLKEDKAFMDLDDSTEN